MKALCLVLVTLLVTVSSALVQGYSVDPVKASWSGWTPWLEPNNYVSEVLTVNFDEPAVASLFCGSRGGDGAYNVNIYSYPGGVVSLAEKLNVDPPLAHHWLACSLEVIHPDSFIKGRQVEVRWTRSGSDSIQFYYDAFAGTKYDSMIVPGGSYQPPPEPNRPALACRVYGVLDPIDSTYWGMNLPVLPPNDTLRRQWADSLEGKVDWCNFYIHWDSIQPRFDSFYFAKLDTQLACMDTADVEPVACLVRCPKWTSTRIDTFEDTVYTNDTFYIDTLVDTCVYCPPRNLWVHPDSSAHANHWARFVDTVVDYTDELLTGTNIGGIHTWEIWNEANEGCTLSPSYPSPWPGYTGWWRRPDTHYTVSSNAHDMCSLYVRLCEVAANTIRSIDGHENDRIIIGAVSRVSEAIPWMSKVKGKAWVDTCYQVATRTCTTGVFWDGVSAHPYQYKRGFSEPLLEQDGADMRAVMRAHEHCDGLLWNTELGWSVQKDSVDTTRTPDSTAANNAAELYATSLAALGSPEGGFDR
ncbi:MAG: hypothetical protein JSU73_03825, partial [candidate division WOR-3 bacterium]